MEDNKQVARRWFLEIVNERDPDPIEVVFAEDYEDLDPLRRDLSISEGGREAVREEIEVYWRAFPDLRYEILDQIAEGDRVATRFVLTGTHEGPFMGVPASGRSFALTGIAIHRVVDGRLKCAWWEWDARGLLDQIGAG